MTEPSPATLLLEAASRAESERVRAGAMRRLQTLMREDARRRRDGAGDPPADRWTERAPAIARLARNVAALGLPRASVGTVDPAAVRLGRRLLSLDRRRLEEVLVGIGRAEAAFLCRSLDPPSAARLVRRLGDERRELASVARALPSVDVERLKRSCRRLAFVRDSEGAELTRALGRRLVPSLLAGAEPDVEAAVLRRAGLRPSDDREPEWISTAERLLEVPR